MTARRIRTEMLQATQTANRVIEDHEITQLPVDPVAIATKHGIKVGSGSLDGVSGCLMKVGDTFGILYSDRLSNTGFERFTISHELGHYFLPGHPEALFGNGATTHHSKSGFVSGDPIERQADQFAASLMMPEQLFVEAMRGHGNPGFPAIEFLSDTCCTSIAATALNYARLAEDPVAVVMSRGSTVEWCEMSDTIRDLPGLTWLRKGSAVPRDVATSDFNRSTDNIARASRRESSSLLSDWFDGAPDVEMMEDVVGLGRYGRTLTVLFTPECIDSDED